jgi:hypothetical protein
MLYTFPILFCCYPTDIDNIIYHTHTYACTVHTGTVVGTKLCVTRPLEEARESGVGGVAGKEAYSVQNYKHYFSAAIL